MTEINDDLLLKHGYVLVGERTEDSFIRTDSGEWKYTDKAHLAAVYSKRICVNNKEIAIEIVVSLDSDPNTARDNVYSRGMFTDAKYGKIEIEAFMLEEPDIGGFEDEMISRCCSS